jgi:hypothetical protein
LHHRSFSATSNHSSSKQHSANPPPLVNQKKPREKQRFKKQADKKRRDEKTNLQTRLLQNLSLPSIFQLFRQRHFEVNRSFRISFCCKPQNSSGKHDSNPSQGSYTLVLGYPVKCLVHIFFCRISLRSDLNKEIVLVVARKLRLEFRKRRSSVRASNWIIPRTISKRT